MTPILLSTLVRKQLPCLLHRSLCPIASSTYLLPGNRRHDDDHLLRHNLWTFTRVNNINPGHTNHRLLSSFVPAAVSSQKRSLSSFLQKPPNHGEVIVKSLLPKAMVPYAQLMRLDKPTGTLLLLWPSYWSILMATEAGSTPDLSTMSLFLVGAILMRGAGCTINDLWDRKYDAQVERTKNRPLASGKIKPLPALFFLAAQLSSALFILTRFDTSSIILGASSMALVVTYPLAKRYTHWAQLILGMTFNWGVLLGYSVVKGGMNFGLGSDGHLIDTLIQSDLSAVLPLYLAGISWTLIYDTIYAHQDKRDDAIIGLKSTAIKFGDKTRHWLSFFSLSMVSSLATSGVVTQQTWPFYASVGIVGLHLANQVRTLKINDPDDCWKKFKRNANIGAILAAGLFVSTLFKDKKKKNEAG